MDQKDLKAIDNLIKNNLKAELKSGFEPIKKKFFNISAELKPIKERLDRNTASLMKIEQKIDAALELRIDVSEIRVTVKNHEGRISQLETH